MRHLSRHLGALTVSIALLALLWVQLSMAQTKPGSLAEAISAQIEWVKTRPEDADAIKDLGNLYAHAGYVEEAEAAYREAIRIAPDDPGAHFNLGLLLLWPEPRASQRLLERAIELDPEVAWAHYTLGTLHQRSGRRKAAIAAFARAFSIDPGLAFADRNPHVIGNDDVTAALLEMEPNEGIQSTPRNYAEPGRVAALLVPDVGAPATEARPTSADESPPEAVTATGPDSANERASPSPHAEVPGSPTALAAEGAAPPPTETESESESEPAPPLSPDDLFSENDASSPPALGSARGRLEQR